MATVSAELIAELGLRVGGSVDVVLAQRLRAESSRLAVFDKAIDLLAVRARSTRDLQMRLRRAGAADASIAAAIERLQQLGFLDDDAYARNLARSRVLSGGVSRRRIGQELQRRGVSREVADGAIAETLEEVELDEEGRRDSRARSGCVPCDPTMPPRRSSGSMPSWLGAAMRRMSSRGSSVT
ncbi:MAG: RecX family transcriptional regulator [Gemmatimonadetes bacterium]|nr:RecX family transcriptional regulator [Gemmatimonadota bacterium]